jgi:hypothetical protein
MTKRVKIFFISIGASRIPFGEGDHLEIYGHIGCWKVGFDFGGNPIDRGHFLAFNQQNDGGAISIALGSPFNLAITSPEFTIESDEELWIGGHLKEADDFTNDSLRDRHKKIRHDDIRSGIDEFSVSFSEGGQEAGAGFQVIGL